MYFYWNRPPPLSSVALRMKPVLSKSASARLSTEVKKVLDSTEVFDVHTHLYDPALGPLLLWGIDELLTYHYLVAEAFRFLDISYDDFWKLEKPQQADLIWDQLFVQHSPISEACRGVLTTLNALGLDVRKRDLTSLRKWFSKQKPEAYLTTCLKLAGIKEVCMTNSPFDDLERPVWEKGFNRDPRFRAGLRIDPLLISWNEIAPRLAQWGYDVRPDLSGKTFSEIRRFLEYWTKKMKPLYLMVSLSPDFNYPSSGTAAMIDCAFLPHCRDFGLPFALMPGVRRAVNPALRQAGDGVGLSHVNALANLCQQNPGNKFIATVLARENQHELCVIARKFRNFHIFGCWWFLNNPSLVDEITRMRLEMLGLSVTLQHSDARVLDQVIYKWRHSREVIGKVLIEKYLALAATGWIAGKKEIERDINDLFGGAFLRFCTSS